MFAEERKNSIKSVQGLVHPGGLERESEREGERERYRERERERGLRGWALGSRDLITFWVQEELW